MTPQIAKSIAIPIIRLWSRKTIWLVKWNAGAGLTECRWFRDEEEAENYARLISDAVITRETCHAWESCIGDERLVPPYDGPPYGPGHFVHLIDD